MEAACVDYPRSSSLAQKHYIISQHFSNSPQPLSPVSVSITLSSVSFIHQHFSCNFLMISFSFSSSPSISLCIFPLLLSLHQSIYRFLSRFPYLSFSLFFSHSSFPLHFFIVYHSFDLFHLFNVLTQFPTSPLVLSSPFSHDFTFSLFKITGSQSHFSPKFHNS